MIINSKTNNFIHINTEMKNIDNFDSIVKNNLKLQFIPTESYPTPSSYSNSLVNSKIVNNTSALPSEDVLENDQSITNNYSTIQSFSISILMMDMLYKKYNSEDEDENEKL